MKTLLTLLFIAVPLAIMLAHWLAYWRSNNLGSSKGYSENDGQRTSLPKGTLELVDTERSIAPVAPSFKRPKGALGLLSISRFGSGSGDRRLDARFAEPMNTGRTEAGASSPLPIFSRTSARPVGRPGNGLARLLVVNGGVR
jgi:hypothetical protein